VVHMVAMVTALMLASIIVAGSCTPSVTSIVRCSSSCRRNSPNPLNKPHVPIPLEWR
jgi:primosomal protein N'